MNACGAADIIAQMYGDDDGVDDEKASSLSRFIWVDLLFPMMSFFVDSMIDSPNLAPVLVPGSLGGVEFPRISSCGIPFLLLAFTWSLCLDWGLANLY